MGYKIPPRINEREQRVKKTLALLGVISLLVLTGCSKLDSAATIGDISISQAQAQGVIDEILEERTKLDTSQMQLISGEELNRGELRFSIISILFDEILKELKLTITESEIAQRRAQLITQIGGEEQLPVSLVAANIAPTNFESYIRAILASDKVSFALAEAGVPPEEISDRIGQLIAAKAKQLNVTVNPRYGVWDFESGDILAKDSAGSAVLPSGQ